MTSRQGQAAEEFARKWLEARGLRTLDVNFTVRGGEIDLIMQDDGVLAMIEVRHRSRSTFGNASESITATKRKRLQLAARNYLLRHPRYARLTVRFDVLALDGAMPTPQVSWIRDAFRPAFP